MAWGWGGGQTKGAVGRRLVQQGESGGIDVTLLYNYT